MKERINRWLSWSAALVLVTLWICWLTFQKPQTAQPVSPSVPSFSNTSKSPAGQPSLVASHPRRVEGRPGALRIYADAQDPQFKDQVLPSAEKFLQKLEKLGISPLGSGLSECALTDIRFITTGEGANATNCTFSIVDTQNQSSNRWSVIHSWVRESPHTSSFDGIMYFGAAGKDSLYRAISARDTNALQRLASSVTWQFPDETAHSTLENAFNTLTPGASESYDPPTFHRERPFGFEVGAVKLIKRIKGGNPINQAEPRKTLVISSGVMGKARLILYEDTVAGTK